MHSEVPSQSCLWGVFSERFQAARKLQLSEIWRFAGLQEEYGTIECEFTREREEKGIIDELAGVLVRTVVQEALARRYTNSSGRSVGCPRYAMIPYLGPELLGVSGTAMSVATIGRWEAQTGGSGSSLWFIGHAQTVANKTFSEPA
jgi:hypothetical protein